MRIAALTPGINVAASRFRVRQYIPALQDAGLYVDEFPAKINYSAKLPGVLGRVRQRYIFPISASWIGLKVLSRVNDIIKSNRYEAVWLNRITVNPLFMERFLKRPLIYDIDDAIWINNEKTIVKIASRSEIILAGNNFIANYFEKYNSNILVIPTAIDTSRFIPSESKLNDLFKIVWTGSRDTMHYLKSIEKPLAAFLKTNKNSRLSIITDSVQSFPLINSDQLEFIPWSPENEVIGIQQASVGIMPLFNTQWEKGKCSYKMLQYMSCGLPVIVSPVGMNLEVLSKGNLGLPVISDTDLISGLNFLYKNPIDALNMGKIGRKVIEENYSLSIVANKLIKVFRNI